MDVLTVQLLRPRLLHVEARPVLYVARSESEASIALPAGPPDEKTLPQAGLAAD